MTAVPAWLVDGVQVRCIRRQGSRRVLRSGVANHLVEPEVGSWTAHVEGGSFFGPWSVEEVLGMYEPFEEASK